ncbi:MAG: hypothetical protein M3069_11190 [Chloroflexota bacterium]|nr:hypothetical protein [Chloroflexota bacterium]
MAIDILNIPVPPPPPTLADLTNIAKAFHISLTQPPGTLQIGQPVRASLVPPLVQGLTFIGVDGVPIISTLTQALTFGMMQKMTKAMLGHAGTVEPSVRTRGAAQLYAGPGGKRHSTATAAPRSGRGALAGTKLAQVPGLAVNVDVQWTLSAFTLFAGIVEMAEGSVFILADPDDPLHGPKPTLSSSVLGLLMQPWVRELTTPPQEPARVLALFFLTAKIRLTAGQVTTDWIELPLAQVPVPVMDLPTVLVLFEDVTFARRLLVCVPGNSLFNSVGPLRDVLKLLRDALQPLATLKNVAGWLLGLNPLIDKLPFDGGTPLAIADDQGRINLEDQVIGRGAFWDDDWEDKVSSILFVGPMGKTAECFSAPGWSGNEGWYYVELGIELAVLVPSLTSRAPASVPIGALTVVVESTDPNFNDRMSSLTLV